MGFLRRGQRADDPRRQDADVILNRLQVIVDRIDARPPEEPIVLPFLERAARTSGAPAPVRAPEGPSGAAHLGAEDHRGPADSRGPRPAAERLL